MNKPELIERINGFRKLSRNWDGYGAQPINGNAVDCAIRLIRSIPECVNPHTLYAFPTVSGGIQIEFDDNTKPIGRTGNLEIAADCTASIWHADLHTDDNGTDVEVSDDAVILEEFVSAYRWVFRQAETCV